MALFSHLVAVRAGDLRCFQDLVEHGAQPHRPHRFVQQMMLAFLRLTQPLRGVSPLMRNAGIAAPNASRSFAIAAMPG